jgi:hypothetical protein
MTTQKAEIKFVRCGQFLLPFKPEDYHKLHSANVRVCKLLESKVDALKKTLLKNYKFVIHDWSDVYEFVVEQGFRHTNKEDTRIRVSDGRILVKYKFTKKNNELNNQAENRLSRFLGRFCFKLKQQSWVNKSLESKGQKVKSLTSACRVNADDGDIVLVAYSVEFDPSIDPSLFYDEVIDKTPQAEATLVLSSFSRLRLVRRPSALNVGRSSLSVIFQDLQGNSEWKESFTRTFELHSVTSEDLADTAAFLLGMTTMQVSESN